MKAMQVFKNIMERTDQQKHNNNMSITCIATLVWQSISQTNYN